MAEATPAARLRGMAAVVFDMDGVVTETAGLHAVSWKAMFDAYLEERARTTGEAFREFSDEDYLRFVDGKPRYDGVRSFLESRGISLPEGDPGDPPDRETVCGLGNRKNELLLSLLEAGKAAPYPSTVDLVAELRDAGTGVAVITSSRNSEQVLRGAGVLELFPVKVDGLDCQRLGLPGKPEPDIFLEATRRLGAVPEDTAIVEDAISGVEAGRRGGFGLIVAVDRGDQADRLRAGGADLVVSDLAELLTGSPLSALPSALDGGVTRKLAARRPAVFLDYDGTLTPIVSHPSRAVLSDAMREALAHLTARHPVAVVSGRDRADVERLVGLPDIVYAGSHGFDISGPGGLRERRGEGFRESLSRAGDELERSVASMDGVWVERKQFALAVHFRQAPESVEEALAEMVQAVASRHDDLRVSGGKKILELRPDMEWDKGRAVDWLLDFLGLGGGDNVPLYLGDDETDEDAFRTLRSRGGIGIVVGEEDRLTLARFRLADIDQVRQFLLRLADWPNHP